MNLKKISRAACLIAGLSALASAPAQAQGLTWTDRVFLNVNFGVQEVSRTIDSESSFSLYGEQGTLTTTQPVDGGGLFDISAGFKVWKNLALGVGFSRVQSDGDVALAASVPDPNFFDRPRAITGVASEAEHSESAVHLQATWITPVTDKFDVAFSLGPTIFTAKQDLAVSIAVTEPGGAISSVEVETLDKTTVGFNIGADLNYFVTPNIGAGVLARYTWGSAEFVEGGESLTLGGFQIGAGLRIRF